MYASGSKGSFVLARGIPDNYHDGRRSADIVFIAGEGARPESNWCVCDIFDCCHWPVGNWNRKLYRSTRMDFSSKHLYLFQLMHGAVHIEAVCGGGALLWFFISYTGKRRRKRHTRHKKQNSGMRKRQQSVALNKNREEAQRTLEDPMPSLRLESSQNLGEGGGLCSQNMGMLTNKSGKLIVCSPFTKPVR